MANYANLLATIAANIYTNGNNEVTAQMVKDAVDDIVDKMGKQGYIFKDFATPATDPGTPDARVFYITTGAGTYTNFGGIEVTDAITILMGTGTSWTAKKLTIAELLYDLNDYVTGVGVNYASKKLYLPVGKRYRIYLLNKGWSIAPGTLNYKFRIYYYIGGIVQTADPLVDIAPADTPKDYYDFAVPDTASNLSVSIKAVDGERVFFKIEELIESEVNITPMFNFVANAAIVTSNGSKNPSGVNSATEDYIDISGASRIRWIMNEYVTAPGIMVGLAFYTASKTFISSVGCNVDPLLSEVIPEERIIDVPANAKYVRTTILTRLRSEFYFYATYQIAQAIEVSDRMREQEVVDQEYAGITHEKPDNIGVLNCIKRARKLTDVRWTPLIDLPRLCSVTRDHSFESEYYEGIFKAGREYVGVPYGRAQTAIGDYGYTMGQVGLDISIDTFVTSVMNPGTLLNEESAYDHDNHESTAFGIVCSGLVSYALGLASFKPTAALPSISGMNYVDDLVNIDPETLRLCDVILQPSYHAALITDILRDENGSIIAVEISEATTSGAGDPSLQGTERGGVARRVGMSVSDFLYWFQDYGLYRYSKLDKITYTPSKFVNVGDEFNMLRYPQMACVPYAGEGFHYKAGSIPNAKILVNTDIFSYMQVKKNGVQWNADGLGGLYAVSGDSVDVNFSTPGEYEACLVNLDENNDIVLSSIVCHWFVD